MRNLYYLLKMARLSLPHKFRKYITIILFLILGFFLFNSAFAVYDPNAKHSKWFNDSIVNDPTVKSTVEVKAQRTYPVSTIGADGKPIIQNKIQKSTIKVAANVGKVGKSLFKRVPVTAITQALIVLLGKSVDWVMDPENNAVKYKEDGSPATTKFLWGVDTQVFPYSTPKDACDALVAQMSKNGYVYRLISVGDSSCYSKYSRYGGKEYETWLSIYSKSVDVPAFPTEDKYLPIDTVAQQVIENADAGDAPSMEVMNNTALDMLEQGLLDSQLEAAADPKVFNQGESDPTDPNQTPTDPTDLTDPTSPTPNPDAKPFELPPFCAWATKVCSFIDWMQAEPQDPDDDGDIEVQIPDPDMHVGILERLYIDMPAACPADPILEFMGARIPFPMSIFCQFAEMMKPLILLFAYIKGLSIIGNGLT